MWFLLNSSSFFFPTRHISVLLIKLAKEKEKKMNEDEKERQRRGEDEEKKKMEDSVCERFYQKHCHYRIVWACNCLCCCYSWFRLCACVVERENIHITMRARNHRKIFCSIARSKYLERHTIMCPNKFRDVQTHTHVHTKIKREKRRKKLDDQA